MPSIQRKVVCGSQSISKSDSMQSIEDQIDINDIDQDDLLMKTLDYEAKTSRNDAKLKKYNQHLESVFPLQLKRQPASKPLNIFMEEPN